MKLVAALLLEKLSEEQPQEVVERIRDPWRKKQGKLTIGQVRQGLRWECWSGQNLFKSPSLQRVSRHNSRAESTLTMA